MKKEDKQELKTQVENFLEYSDALSIYQIYDRIPALAGVVSKEKFGQLLDEWAKEKDSLIKKDTRDNRYTHKIHIENTHETVYYQTVIDWLRNNLNIECTELKHQTANRAKKGIHQWRFPDIVGIRKTNYFENGILKVASLTGQKYFPEIVSLEVKKDLTKSNLRSYFFECLSNSGWANRRYVVVVVDQEQGSKIEDEVISEFRKLSLRYPVGLIQIKTVNTNLSYEKEGSSILVDCPHQDLDLEIMNDLCVSFSEFKDWIASLEEMK